MRVPRRPAVLVATLALAGALTGCSEDTAGSNAPEIIEPAGAEPGVDEPDVEPADPGVDDDAPDAPAIDVEPTP